MHLDYRHTFLALRGAYIGELRINEERATVLSEELSKAIAESAPFIHIAKIYWTYSTRYSTSNWTLISPLLTFAHLDVFEWSKSGDDAPPHCEKMLRESAKAGVAELTLNNSLWKFGRLPPNEDVILDFIFGKTPLNEVYASTNGKYRVFYINYAPISGDFFLKFVQRLSDTSFSHGLNVNLNRIDVNRLLELDLGRYDATKTVNRSKECVLIEIDLSDSGRKATFRIIGSNYFGYKSRVECFVDFGLYSLASLSIRLLVYRILPWSVIQLPQFGTVHQFITGYLSFFEYVSHLVVSLNRYFTMVHPQSRIMVAGTRPFMFVLVAMFTIPLIAGVRLAFDVHVVDTENGYAMRGTVRWVSTR
ncbi:hypothetical protein AAVH_01267 [Aphelenchoides avenae]|nr:hypothetical protein AAVH_01267 [Aphelenchus avenae]